MSRIGRRPITVPAGVNIAIDGRTVTVKGPKGELSHTLAEPITIERDDDGQLHINRPNDERRAKELHGLSRTLVANMVLGVTEGYRKTLEINGTGYRVQAKGSDLEFALGFSHAVTVVPPASSTMAWYARRRSGSSRMCAAAVIICVRCRSPPGRSGWYRRSSRRRADRISSSPAPLGTPRIANGSSPPNSPKEGWLIAWIPHWCQYRSKRPPLTFEPGLAPYRREYSRMCRS